MTQEQPTNQKLIAEFVAVYRWSRKAIGHLQQQDLEMTNAGLAIRQLKNQIAETETRLQSALAKIQADAPNLLDAEDLAEIKSVTIVPPGTLQK